jgi:hypothetical protein
VYCVLKALFLSWARCRSVSLKIPNCSAVSVATVAAEHIIHDDSDVSGMSDIASALCLATVLRAECKHVKSRNSPLCILVREG